MTVFTLVGVLVAFLVNVQGMKTSPIESHNSQESVDSDTLEELEALLEGYAEQNRILKDIIQHRLASDPYTLRKRAQFLRLGRK